MALLIAVLVAGQTTPDALAKIPSWTTPKIPAPAVPKKFPAASKPSPILTPTKVSALTSPPVTLVSTKNYPALLQQGENFQLENTTITFTPQANGNYSWLKGALEWNPDYDGEDPIPLPANPIDFTAKPTPLPFAFPFFGTSQTVMYVTPRMEIAFPKSVPDGKPCLFETLENCAPRILGLGTVMTEGHIFLKKSATEMLVTYLSDPQPEMPTHNIELQFSLQKSGVVKISYKAVQNPMMYDFSVGVYAGTAKTINTYLSQFNNPQKVKGGGPADQSQSLVYFGKGFSVDTDLLHDIIAGLLPVAPHDAVFIVSDFPYTTGSKAAGDIIVGGSLGASTRINYSDVQGIGFPTYCKDNDCNKWSSAKAFIHLKNIKRANPKYQTVKGNDFHQTILHEFGHKWLAFLDYKTSETPCEGNWTNSQCHWTTAFPAAYDTADVTAMYQGKVLNGYGYSMLDLYLMGLAPYGSVPPYGGLTIAHVIEQLGTRVPAYQNSQKTFLAAVVMLTQQDVGSMEGDITTMNTLRGYLNQFAMHFSKVTLGQGKIVFQ